MLKCLVCICNYCNFKTEYRMLFSQRIPLNHFAAYVNDMMKRDKLGEQYEVGIS